MSLLSMEKLQPLSSTILAWTTRVSLLNVISFHPTDLASCTSVADGQTTHAMMTSVAIASISDAFKRQNGKSKQNYSILLNTDSEFLPTQRDKFIHKILKYIILNRYYVSN